MLEFAHSLRETERTAATAGMAQLGSVWRWPKADLHDRRLRKPARQRGGLLHPRRHLRLFEIVLVDVDPARVLARASGWNRSQRRAAKERHLDVVGEDMEPEEPTLALDSVQRRVPLHG